MINTSELRLGNLVMVKCKEELGPATVNMISDDMIGIHWIDKLKHTIVVSNSDCFAIELTEEWLLKFGYKNGQNFFFMREEQIGVIFFSLQYIVSEKRFGFFNPCYSNESVELKSVHHLQNFYHSVTLKELTASC